MTDPGLADEFRREMEPWSIAIYPNRKRVIDGRTGVWAYATSKVGAIPASLAMEAFIRVGEQEYRLGALTRTVRTARQNGVAGWYDGPVAPSVTLVLRSSEQVVKDHFVRGTKGFWQGELVFEDVPVRVVEE